VPSGLCLDVAGGGDTAGTNVDIARCTDTANQIWNLILYSGNAYYVEAQTGPTICLDILSSNQAPGTNVLEWPCSYDLSEKWQIIPTGKNSYYLIAESSYECLDVAGGATAPGTNVDQTNCTDQTNQQWILTPWTVTPPLFANGNYTIRSVASGLCLDIMGGGTVAGTNVDVEICTEASNQIWYLSLKAGDIYYVQPQTGSTICLDILQSSQTPGTPAIEMPCSYDLSEQWQIVPAGPGAYYLIALFSNQCLDVAGGATAPGTIVDQSNCTQQTNQQWIITPWAQPTPPFANGNYTITSVASGLCLDVVGGGAVSGTNVDVETCTNTPNQVWYLNQKNGITYYVQPQVGGTMCLDILGANQAPGTNVLELPCSYGTSEQWQITPAGSNSYYLIAVSSEQCLNVAFGGAATAPGTNVDQSNCTTQTNQQWILTPWTPTLPPFANGNYTITSAATGLCLDVAGGGTLQGTNVDIETCTNTPNQAWYLNLTSGNTYYVQPQTGRTMCLDIVQSSQIPGAKAIEMPCSYDLSEQWQIIPAGNNSYYLIVASSEQCLNVATAGAAASGTNVGQLNCTDQTNQKWILTPWTQSPPPFTNGNYTITSVASGLCLDVAGGGTVAGTNVDIENCTDTVNQVWYLNLTSGNTYYVQPQTGTTICLDILQSSQVPGTQAIEMPCSYDLSEQWQIIPAENNSYYLIATSSEQCLNVATAGAAASGTNVDQWNCTGQTNQQWILTPWKVVPPPFVNGNYTITSATNGLCLDVAGGGTVAGTKVDLENCTNTPNQVWYLNQTSGNIYYVQPQTGVTMCLDASCGGVELPCNYNTSKQWTITPTGLNSFTITSVSSGLCLDVGGGATAILDQDACTGQASQSWNITLWTPTPPPFANGNYTITSVSTGLCLDVAGGGDKPGTNVDVETCTNTPNQAWTLNLKSGNIYYFQPQTGGNMCLDVDGANATPGTNVFEWPCNYNTNEQWQITPAGPDTYYIIVVFSEECLDVAGGGTVSGTNVDQWNCTGKTNQQWIILPFTQTPSPFANGNYTITSVASGLCLDVPGGGTVAGTNVDIEICTQTSNQVWYLNIQSGNTYYVQPQTGSTMCLNILGANQAPGTNVLQSPCTNSTSEQWQIIPAEPNSYYLIAVSSEECLDVAGGATAPGTLVDQSNCTTQTNQQWIITPWVQPTPPLVNANYTVVNVNSGLCLDVAGGATTSGTNVDQATCSPSAGQIWLFTQTGNNSNYYVQPQTTGNVCLDVSGGSENSGANVDQLTCSFASNQQWEVAPASNGTFYLISVSSGLCLDVAASSNASGANVDQYTCTGQTNQQWNLTIWSGCPPGYFWVPELGSCQPCNIKNCDTCEDNQGTVWCTSCLSGYNIEKGTGICVHSVAGWQNCGSGMFWNSAASQCQSCSPVPNCQDCINQRGAPFCTVCSTGYVASATNGTCDVALAIGE